MPFITKERREIIDKEGLSILYLQGGIMPGDRCYFFYKEMVDKWEANPRWTTAHEIFKDMLNDEIVNKDNFIASRLAWQVFFIKYVWPYELKKIRENGDI